MSNGSQGNLNNDHDFGFRALLYYKFIVGSEHDVASVAEKMKISADTLYRYLRGALQFPIDRLPDLVKATGDSKFIDYLANRCGYVLVPQIKDSRTAETMRLIADMFQRAARAGETKE